MDIQAIGNGTYSLYISQEELSLSHIDPSDVTLSQAQDIVFKALGSRHGPLLMDMFPGRRELLIFVHKDVDCPVFYIFNNADNAINAALSLEPSVSASLYYYRCSYILALWLWNVEDSYPLLEFGHLVEHPSTFLLHLAEHGKPLLEGNAVSVIKNLFSPT